MENLTIKLTGLVPAQQAEQLLKGYEIETKQQNKTIILQVRKGENGKNQRCIY